eukprot:TRINITY_DN76808_c0_g1_i1.p2 TRINITY_DN76808_c0_g1~~TRINITY_DN76808_c0_g1_i1.p2  ORF type:complete len:100 (-),score=11.41 TRINITY_DN76808_c0_g1_i1:38-337(-)
MNCGAKPNSVVRLLGRAVWCIATCTPRDTVERRAPTELARRKTVRRMTSRVIWVPAEQLPRAVAAAGWSAAAAAATSTPPARTVTPKSARSDDDVLLRR